MRPRVWRLGPILLALAAGGLPAATTRPCLQVDVPHPTEDKPQSKLWYSHGAWWALLPSAAGPTLWQRSGSGWTEHLEIRRTLAGLPGRADVWFDGDGATAVTVAGTTLAVIRLRAAEAGPPTWGAERLATWTVESAGPIETVTIARDATRRWWLSAPVAPAVGRAENSAAPKLGLPREIWVWTSPDAVTWQRLEPAARGVSGDDICAITPLGRGVGVVWSDQNRDEVGFRFHPADVLAPWSLAEQVDAGKATADDHLHTALGRDGVLWVATKNSVDRPQEPQLVLRRREPAGRWRNLPYAPRVPGEEPSRPVVLTTSGGAQVLVGHTVYARPERHRGEIRFARVATGAEVAVGAFHTVIAPDPALRSLINDLTTPKAPLPEEGPWIVLASDAAGRVFEADLRALPPPAEAP